MFIINRNKFAKIRVPLEMMCARGNLYKKLFFDTVEWFWCYLWSMYMSLYPNLCWDLVSYTICLSTFNDYKPYHIHRGCVYYLTLFYIYSFLHQICCQWFLFLCTITNYVLLYNRNTYYTQSSLLFYSHSFFYPFLFMTLIDLQFVFGIVCSEQVNKQWMRFFDINVFVQFYLGVYRKRELQLK